MTAQAAARIADELITLIDVSDPAQRDMLTRRVRATPAIAGTPWGRAGWRDDPDVPRFGAEEHLEAGWS